MESIALNCSIKVRVFEVHVALQVATLPCRWPRCPAGDHIALQVTTLPCRWPHCPAVDHIGLQLTTLPCRWPDCPVGDHIALQVTKLPCRWPHYPAGDHIALQVNTLPCNWPHCPAGDHIALQVVMLLHYQFRVPCMLLACDHVALHVSCMWPQCSIIRAGVGLFGFKKAKTIQTFENAMKSCQTITLGFHTVLNYSKHQTPVSFLN